VEVTVSVRLTVGWKLVDVVSVVFIVTEGVTECVTEGEVVIVDVMLSERFNDNDNEGDVVRVVFIPSVKVM